MQSAPDYGLSCGANKNVPRRRCLGVAGMAVERCPRGHERRGKNKKEYGEDGYVSQCLRCKRIATKAKELELWPGGDRADHETPPYCPRCGTAVFIMETDPDQTILNRGTGRVHLCDGRNHYMEAIDEAERMVLEYEAMKEARRSGL